VRESVKPDSTTGTQIASGSAAATQARMKSAIGETIGERLPVTCSVHSRR
jgi:hypothetical protein